MSESIETPESALLFEWRLSKRGNLWMDTGNFLATVLQHRSGYWQARVLRKGPAGSPFVGERRLTLFYETLEGAQDAALDLIETLDEEGRP